MVRRGINRVADLDPPTGDQMRAVLRYEHDAPGAMVHVDVKKLGKIPTGGGWRIHGVGSDEHRASKRKGAGTGRIGYTYLHTAIDDHSRLAYTECLEDEKGTTAADFWLRAVTFVGGAVVGDLVGPGVSSAAQRAGLAFLQFDVPAPAALAEVAGAERESGPA